MSGIQAVRPRVLSFVCSQVIVNLFLLTLVCGLPCAAFAATANAAEFVANASATESVATAIAAEFAATAKASERDAADSARIAGRVVDPLGAVVPNARVALLRNGAPISEKIGDARGEFAFEDVASGRYEVRAEAPGFEPRTTAALFAGPGDRLTIEIALRVGPLQQELTVTAAAMEQPTSRSGAPVTVLDSGTLDALGKPDVLEGLRLVPGATVTQIGGRGGMTSLFIRGGASNFAKVLIDGVPANDIGGNFDFSELATTGIDRVEVLRQSNSVLYGSDALSGVVNITTRRGRTLVPEAAYSIDGGNLGTVRQDASVGGAIKRFDYFSDYSHFRTDNDLPNNKYRNGTYAGRFGIALGRATDVSATVRRIDTTYGSPNAFDFFGVADDTTQTADVTYIGVAAQSQIAPRLQTIVRFASMDEHTRADNATPTGEAFDPFDSGFPNYLGNEVTIRGANGYSATGRGILDYNGVFPSIFKTETSRRSVTGQVNYHLLPSLDLSGGARVEHESGFTDSGTRSDTTRTNGGAFVEAQGRVLDRVYANAGLGIEHNEVFGNAFTPRVSIAVYLHTAAASSTESIGDTKLTLNAGRGIKAPTIAQELTSLYGLVQQAPAGTRPAIDPIGPERSRSFDIGIEQALWRHHARVRAAFFDNQFSDLIEFVSKSVLPQLGVPADAIAATSFGAYVNSSSYRARGLETSGEVAFSRVRVIAGYTRLDAEVNKSFASSALAPAINPAFPGIAIGAYSPLVGARPFRRPANSGNLLVSYTDGPLQVALSGYFIGEQDDSTFLSDGFFGNSLLLPNKDLDAAYRKLDVSAAYRIHPRLRWYLSIENVSDETYEAAAGFPALPRTFRTGVTISIGGEK